MALRVPTLPRSTETDQLLSWEAELEERWSQLQARRRSAEQLRERQMLLEASLQELSAENVATELVLEERRRALSARQAQLHQDEVAQRQQAVVSAAETDKKRQAVEAETRSIDAAWRELERLTQQDDAAHTDAVRALQWSKQRSIQRDAEARARLDTLRERETHLLALLDSLVHRKRHSTQLLRQTLTQLQRELEERQALLSRDGESPN